MVVGIPGGNEGGDRRARCACLAKGKIIRRVQYASLSAESTATEMQPGMGGPSPAKPVMGAPVQQTMGGPEAALEALPAVLVKQQFNPCELCSVEMPNRYKVHPLDDPNAWKQYDGKLPIYYVKERMEGCGDCLVKQCLGPCRPSITDFFVGADESVTKSTPAFATYFKSCGLEHACTCCKSTSFLKKLATGAVSDIIASTSCFWPCARIEYKIGSHYAIQSVDACACMSLCPCNDYELVIIDTKTGERVGNLAKKANGCEECLTGTNRYLVVFPQGSTADEKLELVSSAIHLDYNFFEQSKNDN